MAEKFTNKASTTLNGAINNAVTSLIVTSATGFPTTGDFRIVVDPNTPSEEVMTVTAVSGTTYTVTRASEAIAGVQTAFSHADLAVIKHVLTAGALGVITAAVTDYTENTASQALAASGTVVTRTVTLVAGTYMAVGHVRTSAMTTAASPGHCTLRKGGSVMTGSQKDLRTTAAAQFVLTGYFTHTGGSVTVDVFFNRESGTTTFGVVGSTESRFANSLHIVRIGD